MILVGLLATSPALACVLNPPAPLVVDPTVKDDLAPAAPVLVDVTVFRGRGGTLTPDGNWMSSSCDDIGSITIALERPAGDPDRDDEVGYRLVQLDGTLPEGFDLFPDPMLGPELSLHWIDDATDEQEAFAFTVAVTPVDVAGNEGDPLEVLVADDGGHARDVRRDLGCATTGGASSLLAWAGLAAARLRRRPKAT